MSGGSKLWAWAKGDNTFLNTAPPPKKKKSTGFFVVVVIEAIKMTPFELYKIISSIELYIFIAISVVHA